MNKNNLHNSGVSESPDFIDGARVIKWAWSGLQPFGFVGNDDDADSEAVYGLAICKYEDSGVIYRFSCDRSWDTIQDSPYNTVESAISRLPDQYKNVEAVWQTK